MYILSILSGKKRKGVGNASSDVDGGSEDTSLTDDGSRLVMSGGEGYVDFRIGMNSALVVIYSCLWYMSIVVQIYVPNFKESIYFSNARGLTHLLEGKHFSVLSIKWSYLRPVNDLLFFAFI